jgi:hypothetical protein
MNQPIKILHIDPEYKVTYLIYRSGSSIQSTVNLQEAIDLLKTVDFDMVISEPHNRAILNKPKSTGPSELSLPKVLNGWVGKYDDFGKVPLAHHS